MHSYKRVGVAVSGGPDSMALLQALLTKREPLGFPLFVITVNHNIRPKEESAADACFVVDFCARHKIFCEVITLAPNEVVECEKERKKGIEEAARFLRYAAFKTFARKHNLDVICLGHTKSDQLETLLQRFLQGADVSSLAGIPQKRDIFFRPLMPCSREDIMQYVQENNVPYVIDKTNDQNDYLRNKTRNILIPLLNENYCGWQKSLLHGSEKISDDVDLINSIVDSCEWGSKNATELCMAKSIFLAQHKAIQRRLLQRAVTTLGCKARIPYLFFKNALTQTHIAGYGVEIAITSEEVVVKKSKNYRKEEGFFAIIRSVEQVRFFAFSADIVGKDSYINMQKSVVGPFSLPLIIRSAESVDSIKTANGSYKKISDILAAWKVPKDIRHIVPIIEVNGEVLAVCASFLGYKDWYVQHTCSSKDYVCIHFERI